MTESTLVIVDQEARRSSWAAMSEEIGLLDGVLLHMGQGLNRLSATPNDRGLNLLAALLLTRAFNSLWRAREDAISGYPVQSLTLCRAALEDWGTLMYVNKHPETCNIWLRGVLPDAGETGAPPHFKDIWTDLGEDIGEPARQTYAVLSVLAHPRDEGLPWLASWDAGGALMRVGGYFDQSGLTLSLYFALIVAEALFEPIAQFQSRIFGLADRDWWEQGVMLGSLAEKFVNEVQRDPVLGLEQSSSKS